MKKVEYDKTVFWLYDVLQQCFTSQAIVSNKDIVNVTISVGADFYFKKRHYKVFSYFCDKYGFDMNKTICTYRVFPSYKKYEIDFFKENKK